MSTVHPPLAAEDFETQYDSKHRYMFIEHEDGDMFYTYGHDRDDEFARQIREYDIEIGGMDVEDAEEVSAEDVGPLLGRDHRTETGMAYHMAGYRREHPRCVPRVGDLPMSTREAWLKYAVMCGTVGDRVVYVCASHDSTRDAFRVAEKLSKRKPFAQWVSRIYCARGEQQIRFTSGGVVMFLNPYCHSYRGASSDVLILEYGAETTGTAASLLGARAVHRTIESCPETISEATE